MALATVTRMQLRQRVAGALGLRGLFTGTASNDGATTVQSATTLVDASADGLKDTAWTAARFGQGAILGLWAGAAGTAYEWSQLVPGGYTPSAGTVQIGRNFATTPVDAVTAYELHSHNTTPDEIHSALNWACRNAVHAVAVLLPGLVPDGDMEASGTTNWSGANALVAKTTAAGTVARRSQSLSVITTLAGGYAESPSIPVGGGTQHTVFATVRATGGTASVVVRDQTNGAAIDVSWGALQNVAAANYGDFRVLLGTFVTPTTCASVRLRLQNDTIATTSYFDDVCLYAAQAMHLALPASLFDPDNQLVDVIERRYFGSGQMDFREVKLRPYYGAEGDPAGETAYRLRLPPGFTAPVAVEAALGFAELTSDASTVPDWAQEWLTAGALMQLYEMGARPRGLDQKEFAQQRAAAASQWYGFLGGRNPLLTRSRPVRTTLPSGPTDGSGNSSGIVLGRKYL